MLTRRDDGSRRSRPTSRMHHPGHRRVLDLGARRDAGVSSARHTSRRVGRDEIAAQVCSWIRQAAARSQPACDRRRCGDHDAAEEPLLEYRP